MAGSLSTFLENALLNHTFKVSEFTVPTNLYIALFVTAPDDDNVGGVEVSTIGTGYIRQVANAWTPSAEGLIANESGIAFSEATALWGIITAFGIFDAVVDGNLLAWGNMTITKNVTLGDVVEFGAGAITVTLD